MQRTEIRTYRQKPMSDVTREKVEHSHEESLDLTERELRCPYCNYFIMTLYSDVKGHLRAKCDHCKQITTYNLGYFRRVHSSQLKFKHSKQRNSFPRCGQRIDWEDITDG